jgi:nicotinamidase-related amidase
MSAAVPGPVSDATPLADAEAAGPLGPAPTPPAKSAVLVIDMLNFFAIEGDEQYQRRFWDVVDRIRELREVARAQGALWIYVNTLFDSEESFAASPLAKKSPPHWLRGTHESEVVAPLTPGAGDLIVAKTVNSGFYDTPLDDVLHENGARRVILTGVHTHVCIALTAADAFYRNYDVVVVPECVTTIDMDRHDFGLGFIDRHLGRIVRLANVESLFE